MFYKLPPTLDHEIDELDRLVQDTLAGRMSAAELKAHRVPFGVYEQRQDNTFMMRIRCPGGAVTPRQLRAVTQLSKDFGAPYVHVTTRQELQLHDIQLKDVIPIMRELKKVGLSTRGGGGNTVRNLTASPSAGADPEEVFDVSPYLFALTSRFLAEPDSWLLPRKFKVAFSNTAADTAQAAFHDVGFIAATQNGQKGFSVFLAGGLGAKPAAGHKVHDFLPAEDAYLTAEAVKRLFHRHGNRRDKQHNRLRFLWEDLGEKEFLSHYYAFVKQAREEKVPPLDLQEIPAQTPGALPAPLRSSGDGYERWKRRYTRAHKQTGYRQVLLPIPLGNLPLEQAFRLADFLEPFGADVLRGTREQNFLLRHIPEELLGNVYELVKDWNLLVGAAPFLGRAVTCTGASTCKLGICLPRPALTAVTEHLLKAGLTLDDLDGFQMNLSGCPNSCGNHWAADLGFYGKAARKDTRVYPAYNVVAGGRTGGGSVTLAEPVGEVAAKHLPAFINKFIETYLGKKARFSSFRDYLDTEGKDDLKGLCPAFQEAPDFEKAPEFYTDWGTAEAFSLAGRGQGECSAGLYDLIEFDLKQAQGSLAALDGEDGPAHRAESIYHLALFTARALLITRGAEPHGEPSVFDLFDEHFVRTGLVDTRYGPLLAAARAHDLAALAGQEALARELSTAINDLYKRMDNSFHFTSEASPAAAKAAAPATTAPGAAVEALFKDLRGVACPMNFVKTKLVLEGMAAGQRLLIFLDDGAPVQNVPRSVEGEGHRVLEQTKVGPHWSVLIEKK